MLRENWRSIEEIHNPLAYRTVFEKIKATWNSTGSLTNLKIILFWSGTYAVRLSLLFQMSMILASFQI